VADVCSMFILSPSFFSPLSTYARAPIPVCVVVFVARGSMSEEREMDIYTFASPLVSHLSACGDYRESSLSARRDRDSIS